MKKIILIILFVTSIIQADFCANSITKATKSLKLLKTYSDRNNKELFIEQRNKWNQNMTNAVKFCPQDVSNGFMKYYAEDKKIVNYYEKALD